MAGPPRSPPRSGAAARPGPLLRPGRTHPFYRRLGLAPAAGRALCALLRRTADPARCEVRREADQERLRRRCVRNVLPMHSAERTFTLVTGPLAQGGGSAGHCEAVEEVLRHVRR